ncbi:chemotaxis protein CheB [Coraliomargarita sp. W4R72]
MPLPPSVYFKHIVVIGASEGGLPVLGAFFQSVPVASNRCFFIISDLLSEDVTMMGELLATHTCMPLLEMVDGGLLEPNKIFVCPSGCLPIADGIRVRLQARETRAQQAIDTYLDSLVESLGSLATVVILSGAGEDGTRGAKRVQAAGGAVFVQSPQECEFPSMPQSVLRAGVPCLQGSPQGLWQMIEARGGSRDESLSDSRAANEELGAANEELRAANEELQRSNKALRATNEALTVSKLSHEKLLGQTQEGVLQTLTDMTDVKALQRRFEYALESVRMSWWDWDLRLDEITVNAGKSRILGKEFFASKQGYADFMQQVHCDDYEMIQATLGAHLRGETDEWACELRLLNQENEWIWVSNRGFVTQRDSSGKAVYMMGNTVVIDTLKKALVEATYQRDMLAAAGQIASLGTWEYTVETDRVVWSDQIRNIMEVDADFDPNLEDSFGFFPAPDRNRLGIAFKALTEDGTPYDLELRCVSQKGRHMYTLAAGRPQYDQRGKIVGAVGVFQDITKTELREHEMQAFFALSPDFQATVDFDGTFQSCSPSWLKELGYPEGFLAHTPVVNLVVPEHRIDFLKCFSSVVAGAAIANYETRVLNYAGYPGQGDLAELWLSWSFSSEPDLKLVFVSARCVTEQRQTNQRLIDERVRAEQANSAKSDFLAVMSHELRTPLNPILGFSELLLAEIENPEHREILQTIVGSGEHLIGLIDEVLDYSKLEACKTEITLSEFSLEEFTLRKIRLMRGQIKNEDVRLTHSICAGPLAGDELPDFVGDLSMITQIVRNLLSNALKFTRAGEVSLAVEVESVENGVAMVCFSVSDSGVGIAPEDHEKIFEAFTQVDTSNTRQFGGTGLGLAICKQLSDLLGGHMTLESALGQGATFELHVPLKYVARGAGHDATNLTPQTDPSDAQSEASSTIASEGSTKQPEVLIVEDNDTNQFYLDTVLKRQGCLPTIVEDGESAIALIEEDLGRFKWIFLDLHMPGMGGLAALDKIREAERKASVVPSIVIVMTADAEDSVYQQSMEKGANEFLIKPAPVQEVLGLLDKYLVRS